MSKDDPTTEAVAAERAGGDPDGTELVRVAVELGYFDVPRETTLDELARRLECSDVEASRRLRNGIRRLVEADGDPCRDERTEGTA